MPVLSLHIDDAEFRTLIRRIERAGGGFKAPLKAAAQALDKSTDKRFEDAIDPKGKEWAALSSKTLKKKKNDKILIESTDLRGSIAARSDDTQAEVGTNLVYGPSHQFGREPIKDKRGRTLPAIPARPFLGLSDDDRTELIETFKDYLEQVLSA